MAHTSLPLQAIEPLASGTMSKQATPSPKHVPGSATKPIWPTSSTGTILQNLNRSVASMRQTRPISAIYKTKSGLLSDDQLIKRWHERILFRNAILVNSFRFAGFSISLRLAVGKQQAQ